MIRTSLFSWHWLASLSRREPGRVSRPGSLYLRSSLKLRPEPPTRTTTHGLRNHFDRRATPRAAPRRRARGRRQRPRAGERRGPRRMARARATAVLGRRRGSQPRGDLRGRTRPAASKGHPVPGHIAGRERADFRRGLHVGGRAAPSNVEVAGTLLIGGPAGQTSVPPGPAQGSASAAGMGSSRQRFTR
jgi:hypothetical protein